MMGIKAMVLYVFVGLAMLLFFINNLCMCIRNTCFGVYQYPPSDDNDDLELQLPTSAYLRNPAGEQLGVGPGQSEGDIEQSEEQAAPGNGSSGQADGAPGHRRTDKEARVPVRGWESSSP